MISIPHNKEDGSYPFQLSLLVRRSIFNGPTKKEWASMDSREKRLLFGENGNFITGRVKLRFPPRIPQSVFIELRAPKQSPLTFIFDAATQRPDIEEIAYKVPAMAGVLAAADLYGSYIGPNYAIGAGALAAIHAIATTRKGKVREIYSEHPIRHYHDRIDFQLTPDKFREALMYLSDSKRGGMLYNYHFKNCADFAISIVDRLGLSTPLPRPSPFNTVDSVSRAIRTCAEDGIEIPACFTPLPLVQRLRHPAYTL